MTEREGYARRRDVDKTMWLKWLGMTLIFFASTAMGWEKGSALGRREQHLEELLQMLLLLKGEIRFGRTTLREACLDAAERMPGCCGTFLRELGEVFSGKRSGEAFSTMKPGEAFLTCAERAFAGTGLSEEELAPLLLLGRHLGYLDTQMQLKQLELCEEEIRQSLFRIRKDLPQKQKLYRNLGILGGLMLTILLW